MKFERRFRSVAALPVPIDKMGTVNGLFFLWQHVPHEDLLAPKNIPFSPQPGFGANPPLGLNTPIRPSGNSA